MRLFIPAVLALAGLAVHEGSASAQVVRYRSCGGCTRVVVRGPGSFGAVPVGGFGAVPVGGFGAVTTYGGFGAVPVGGYGGFGAVPAGFGGVPTFGGYGAVPAGFGGAPADDQYGSVLSLLATQVGMDLLRHLLAQGQAPSAAPSAAPAGGGLQFPRATGGPGGGTPAAGADLAAINQKLDAILAGQVSYGTKILEAVSATDKKLDAVLLKLDAIKPPAEKK